MRTKNNIQKLIITVIYVTALLAGTGKSVGTAGAMELRCREHHLSQAAHCAELLYRLHRP